MGAITHTMELIAHSMCIADNALSKVVREGCSLAKQPCSMGKAWNPSLSCTQVWSLLMPIGSMLIVGLKAHIRPIRPATPMVICAKLWPFGRGSQGDTWRFPQTC